MRNQKAFDAVFGTAMVLGDKSHRLPPEAFSKSMVVAAIHRGRAMVNYSVERITLEGPTLTVRYATKLEPSATAEFACPLILSIPQGDFVIVQFIEDGKEIKKMAVQPPAAFQIHCKEPDSMTARIEAGTTIFVIKGGSGIGKATVRRIAEDWPQPIVLRVYLTGLEHLAISHDTTKLAGSVLSHSGNTRLLNLSREGHEGPQLEPNNPYWMEIQTHDAAGQPIRSLPPKGGWFEMTIPQALLTGAEELEFEWTDFYR